MPRKGENIRKREDGRWEGRYIKARDFSGKAVYASVYAATYIDVKRKLNEKFSKSKTESFMTEPQKPLEKFYIYGLKAQVLN